MSLLIIWVPFCLMIMSKRVIQNLSLFLFLLLFLSISPVSAQKTISDANSTLNTVANRSGIEKTDVPALSGTLIKNALQLVGIIFFILVVYAGFRWMLARGKEEDINTARQTIIMATIGIVVVVGAYALVNFLTSRVIDGTPNTGTLTDPDTNDYTKVGCCFDKVRYPGSPLELRQTNWQWRITSKGDCIEQGTTATPEDGLIGDGTWEFIEVDSRNQCEAAYNTFCQQTECFDLGFE